MKAQFLLLIQKNNLYRILNYQIKILLKNSLVSGGKILFSGKYSFELSIMTKESSEVGQIRCKQRKLKYYWNNLNNFLKTDIVDFEYCNFVDQNTTFDVIKKWKGCCLLLVNQKDHLMNNFPLMNMKRTQNNFYPLHFHCWQIHFLDFEFSMMYWN